MIKKTNIFSIVFVKTNYRKHLFKFYFIFLLFGKNDTLILHVEGMKQVRLKKKIFQSVASKAARVSHVTQGDDRCDEVYADCCDEACDSNTFRFILKSMVRNKGYGSMDLLLDLLLELLLVLSLLLLLYVLIT